MADPRVRWGVMGTANIGRVAVIPALQAARNCTVTAVASRSGKTAAGFARQMGIPQAYGSYEALLQADDVDAVYIPLPNSLHREWVIRAAEAGKHILCEKPLGLTAQECLEMASEAEARRVLLMEAFMYRFHPRTEKVLEIVGSGVLGPLRLIHAAFTFRLADPANIRWQPNLGGGALMDVGCYCVNICRTAAQEEPTEVQAVARWAGSGVDDQMVATLRFPSGLLAQFDCALSMERREVYQVAGAEAHLEVPAAFLPGKSDTAIYERHGQGAPKVHPIAGADQYQRMVEHFADSILLRRPVRYGPAEAAANMRTIEALYRSSRQGGLPVAV
ncbi:MAG: Gfo/Idh/MocA family oxidoreductase [Chloroflexi bacterium]|nr:Gfo/Idh/MocA family oxidoreductase [Chloroflexota bacterium]